MDKKTIDQCKKKLSKIKDAYKKSKDNNKKSGTSPQFCSFYSGTSLKWTSSKADTTLSRTKNFVPDEFLRNPL